MNIRTSGLAATATFLAVAAAATVRAHHSNAMLDSSTPIWVRGTVLRYEPISPHALIELRETKADGTPQVWTVEGPFPGRLARILTQNKMAADEPVVKPGDAIEVCGFDLRPDLRVAGKSVEPLYPSSKFMHAPLIVMANGRMQSWGPYGKLDNCVRSSDRANAWSAFLNADLLAHDLWCAGRRNTKAESVAPKALVDEINGLITARCE